MECGSPIQVPTSVFISFWPFTALKNTLPSLLNICITSLVAMLTLFTAVTNWLKVIKNLFEQLTFGILSNVLISSIIGSLSSSFKLVITSLSSISSIVIGATIFFIGLAKSWRLIPYTSSASYSSKNSLEIFISIAVVPPAERIVDIFSFVNESFASLLTFDAISIIVINVFKFLFIFNFILFHLRFIIKSYFCRFFFHV